MMIPQYVYFKITIIDQVTVIYQVPNRNNHQGQSVVECVRDIIEILLENKIFLSAEEMTDSQSEYSDYSNLRLMICNYLLGLDDHTN